MLAVACASRTRGATAWCSRTSRRTSGRCRCCPGGDYVTVTPWQTPHPPHAVSAFARGPPLCNAIWTKAHTVPANHANVSHGDNRQTFAALRDEEPGALAHIGTVGSLAS